MQVYSGLYVTSQGAQRPLISILQTTKFCKVILEAHLTQTCSMDILRLTIEFIKMSKFWSLCIEFYGACQLLAMRHRTPYLYTCIYTYIYIYTDQTVDMFIKPRIISKTFIIQIWVNQATKIDIKNWHHHRKRNNLGHTTCSCSIARKRSFERKCKL